MGNFLDGVLAVAAMVGVFVILLTGMYIFEEMKTTLPADEYPTVNNTTTQAQEWLVMFDGLTVFGFFSLMMFILLVAYLMPSNTAFAALLFIVMIVSIPIIEMLKVFVDELIIDVHYAPFVSYFPMTLLIIENSTLIVSAVLILAAFIQYGKGQLESSGGGGIYG